VSGVRSHAVRTGGLLRLLASNPPNPLGDIVTIPVRLHDHPRQHTQLAVRLE
jgi:hypothetical protein